MYRLTASKSTEFIQRNSLYFNWLPTQPADPEACATEQGKNATHKLSNSPNLGKIRRARNTVTAAEAPRPLNTWFPLRGVPMKALLSASVLALAFVASTVASAQTATQTVTFAVNAINQISATGSP